LSQAKRRELLSVKNYNISNRGIAMKMIHSYIEINSSCENIWGILLDFNAYPDWNPFIKEIQGEAKVESKINVQINVTGSKPKKFNPVVKTIWENKQFCWLGSLSVPGLLEGKHMFILEELDTNKTRFHQNEVFRGILVPFFDDVLKKTQLGFNEMNRALKERAESA
jgi:hypothetical protein